MKKLLNVALLASLLAVSSNTFALGLTLSPIVTVAVVVREVIGSAVFTVVGPTITTAGVHKETFRVVRDDAINFLQGGEKGLLLDKCITAVRKEIEEYQDASDEKISALIVATADIE
jgi:hypothetical protein